MNALLPRSLFGQTLAILLAGIGLAVAAGAWVYTSARQEAVRAVGALAAAERIVNSARLVLDVPPEWRARVVAGANDPTFSVTLLAAGPPPLPEARSDPDAATTIAALLREALPQRKVTVVVHDAGLGDGGPPYGRGMGRGPGAMPGHGGLGHTALSWRGLDVAVELDRGQWLAFATRLPNTGPAMSPRLLLALLVAVGIIAALTAWAVRRATAPLRLLSGAAEQLGRNVERAPLPLTGSLEMQRAASAFNDMQARLRRLIENRTLMLAAISHDLRTELTLLRLRAEAVEPAADRERILATIGDMEAMLIATLSFAREEAISEPPKRFDVGSLVSSVVDDLADVGRPVTFEAPPRATAAELKPMAIRRALTNLIENAIKYGTRARVSVAEDRDRVAIIVDDDGPGIPAADLERVVQPFVRLDGSRSRDTGGMGLGLAIAAAAADAHGGRLKLANRQGGGLRATLELPQAQPA